MNIEVIVATCNFWMVESGWSLGTRLCTYCDSKCVHLSLCITSHHFHCVAIAWW